jgi:hypothetical protein
MKILLSLSLVFSFFVGPNLFAESNIEQNKSGEYGHGYIIGRPVRSAYKGYWYQTYELSVNQGGFTDTSVYIGANFDMSTESEAIFNQFKTLDLDRLYVYEYVQKVWWDPEQEDSHYQVVKIYTKDEFNAKMNADPTSKLITAKTPYKGSQASNGTRKGRLVDVERFGQWGNFCSFEINTGGLGSEGHESLLVFTVMDEDICKWVESSVGLGKDIEVGYDQDVWETWQPSDHFANSVMISDEHGQNVAVNPELAAPDLETFKQKLLNDPEFIKELAKKLK